MSMEGEDESSTITQEKTRQRKMTLYLHGEDEPSTTTEENDPLFLWRRI